MANLTNMPTLATLLMALAGPPVLGIIGARTLGESPSVGMHILFHFGMWGFFVLVVFVVLRVERLPLASIGLRRPRWSTIVAGVLLALGFLYLLPPVATWLLGASQIPSVDKGVREMGSLPVSARLFIAMTAGTVEETLYRGYAIERLAALTGRYWIGGLVATLAFGLAHLPAWGAYAIVDLVFGVMATVVYLWRRDLLANIMAHALALVVVLLQLPPAVTPLE